MRLGATLARAVGLAGLRPFGATARFASSSSSSSSSSLQIEQTLCLSDNYGFVVHDPASGLTATVDTPEVGPIEAVLQKQGWTLTHILNTHHHADHSGGNLELKAAYPGCQVRGRIDRPAASPTFWRRWSCSHHIHLIVAPMLL